MTEQERFVDKGIITIEDQGLTDTLTDKDYWVEDGLEDIVELLNNLHKENEELKKRIEYFKEAKQEYKADWKYASARAEKYEDKCDSLQDENEELEQIIKEAYNILQEADLFSDKATNHDTIAYKEMLKMDNKDAYTIANGIKEALKILKEMIE